MNDHEVPVFLVFMNENINLEHNKQTMHIWFIMLKKSDKIHAFPQSVAGLNYEFEVHKRS